MPTSIPVLLRICCLLLFPGLLSAQNLNSCAYAHAQSTAREAVATTAHIKRMNQYDVTFYKLDLELERNSTATAGEVTTRANLSSTRLDTFAFELHPNFEIASVTINGETQQNIVRSAGDVSVRLATPLQAPATLTAVIRYSGTAPTAGGGYRTATEGTWGNQVSWSLSEPFFAYEWWPTKQVLTDKADSVHVFVTTSADNKVGSNGLLTAVTDLPDGRKRHEWKSRYPIVYYLVSVALSNYEEYVQLANPAGAAAPIPILNYVYRGGALTQFKTEIDYTAPLIEYFSELFSLYPFHQEKYGHSMAPIGGGMEHQTMTTQSTFVLFLTAHELGHQWFGNNVTCASWQDIWLNEGFASYTEYLAYQQFRPAAAEPWMLEAHTLALQQPTGTIRVADTTNVSRIFDYRLTYKKGAAVVHMLRHEINDDALFFQALRNYQQQLGDGTATTADLQRVLEQTINRSLNHFFEQWYNGNGYPIFEVEWNQQETRVLLLSNQTPSGTTPLFTTDVEYLFTMADGSDTLVRVPHTKPNEQYVFNFNSEVTSVSLDPNNWLLNDLIGITKNSSLVVPTAIAKPLLYPNPAYSVLRLENLVFTPTLAEIYDSTGRLVKQQALRNGASPEIQVTALPAGLYILQISNSQDRFRTTFIKVQQP